MANRKLLRMYKYTLNAYNESNDCSSILFTQIMPDIFYREKSFTRERLPIIGTSLARADRRWS